MSGTSLFTVGSEYDTNVQAALTNEESGVTLAYFIKCTGAPPTTANKYAPSCIAIRTDAGSGNKGVYENTGTAASPSWNLMGDVAAGEITLAEGSLLVGNSSGVAAALAAETDTQILVGDGTTVASVAVSGDATLANTGALTLAAGAVTGAKASTALNTKVVSVRIGGIPNSGDDRYLFVAPSACTIANVSLVSDTATTGSDGSNNYTFQVANLTQTQDLLSAVVTTNSNEIAADTVFDITPDQNATIAANDVLELQIVENGTATDLTSAEVFVQVEYTVAA